MNRVARIGWPVAAIVALAAAVAIIITRFEVTGDITAFLPDGDGDERVAISKALASSGLGKGMVLVVHGPADAPGRVTTATRRLADALAGDERFEWVQTGVGDDGSAALRALFFPARMGFLSDRPAELEARLAGDGLAAAARRLKKLLTSPLGATVRSTVGSDPLLAFRDIVERAAGARPPTIDVEAGVFVTSGEAPKRGVIFLATVASPFAAAAQGEVLALIAAEADKLGDDIRVEMTGVNVLAVDGEKSTRADVKRISVISLVGTALLFFLCFRRLRYFVALAIPIGFGVAGGLAACLVVFGEVHGMTLAFGATLIGVSVDYVLHFLSHHTLEARAPRATLAVVWPGIALGGATTVVGFAGMGLTSTAGMRQIALFGALGIVFALLATYAVLPLTVGASPARGAHRGIGVAREPARRWLARLGRHPGLALALGALITIGAAFTLPRLDWNDNPRGLATTNDELMKRDERIRGIVATGDSGRFVVARGADWESALQANDNAARILEEARAAGELGGFRSLHSLLWSRQLQEANIAAVWGSGRLAERLRAAMAAEGFRPEAFDEFAALLAGPPPAAVTAEAVLASPLHPLVRGFYARDGDDGAVMILSQLSGVADSAALARRLETTSGVTYFDQAAFLETSYGGFRRRVLEVVAVSLLAVFALVVVRYRRWRLALAAFVPALLAAASALTLLGLVGVTLNLLHVLGLMLVLSIGVDYGVFLVEATRHEDDVSVTLLGAAVSCATTILGFGLLAMSSNPALQALGSVTAIGCLLSLVFAPIAVALLGIKLGSKR